MSEQISFTVDANDHNFDDIVLRSPIPVLVEFWAPWCQPSRILKPTIDNIAIKYDNAIKVVRVNTDISPKIQIRFGVKSIPALGIFARGVLLDSIFGLASQSYIEQKLEIVNRVRFK